MTPTDAVVLAAVAAAAFTALGAGVWIGWTLHETVHGDWSDTRDGLAALGDVCGGRVDVGRRR